MFSLFHFWGTSLPLLYSSLYFSPQVALLMRLRFTICVTEANKNGPPTGSPAQKGSTSSWIHSSYNNVAGMTFFYNEFHHFLSDWCGFNWYSWTHYSFLTTQLTILANVKFYYEKNCVHNIFIQVSSIDKI